jgi:two-component system invasion response regulator UvrY
MLSMHPSAPAMADTGKVAIASLERKLGPQTKTAAHDVDVFAHIVERGSVTSVLVVDDHPVARQGCRRVLERIGITNVYEASDTATGCELFARHRPEIAVVDLGLRDNRLDGLVLIRRFSAENPKAHILVLSMHSDPLVVSRALRAGAASYVVKDAGSEELLMAFRAVQEGKSYLSGDLGAQLSRSDPPPELTPRELETLTLLSEGKTYSGIADELNVSYKTIANISSRLRKKLHARNLPALVGKAIKLLATVQ